MNVKLSGFAKALALLAIASILSITALTGDFVLTAVSKDEKKQDAPQTVETQNQKVKPAVSLMPVQFCQGTYKRGGGTSIEIITVKCPNADDRCSCEADEKSLKEWVVCGGARKNAAKNASIMSCESKIIGAVP